MWLFSNISYNFHCNIKNCRVFLRGRKLPGAIVARPALSASRGIDIIDFLASFPESAFTMSEIARAISVNVASCHSILNELTDRGYLTRHATLKTYSLGPALVAVGNAALRNQSLIAHAQVAAEALSRERGGIQVALTRAIGDEVLGIFVVPTPDRFGTGGLPGFRLPMMPPIGAPFLAWASERAIDEWIARRPHNVDEKLVEFWRSGLAFVRQRGYQVLLRPPSASYFPKFVAELAAGQKVSKYKNRIAGYFESQDQSFLQPADIDPKEFYDVMLIAAPIFDRDGNVLYNLVIRDLPGRVSGEAVLSHADSLLSICVQLMRDDHVA
jgi:DNA-binding IclR family transcriptional regulator